MKLQSNHGNIYSDNDLLLEENIYFPIDEEVPYIKKYEYSGKDNPINKNSNNLKEYLELVFNFMEFKPSPLSQKKLIKKENRGPNELEYSYTFNGDGQIEELFFTQNENTGLVYTFYYE